MLPEEFLRLCIIIWRGGERKNTERNQLFLNFFSVFSDHCRILCEIIHLVLYLFWNYISHMEVYFNVGSCVCLPPQFSTTLSLSDCILLGNQCLGEGRATFSTLLWFIAVCEENGKTQWYSVICNYYCPSCWNTFHFSSWCFLGHNSGVSLILPLSSGYPHR